MWPLSNSTEAKRLINFKQQQRVDRIIALVDYHKPLSSKERSILSRRIQELVDLQSKGELTAGEIIKAYGKKALTVHESTNALTEVFIDEAAERAKAVDSQNVTGPLKGVPVSLKDCVYIAGQDTTSGYARYANRPLKEDEPLVKLLRDAGAVFYVKTNIPTTTWSIDGKNDVWGQTTNPYSSLHSPGGSSSGEGALIGGGGSRIGVGSDIGGSVRTPAANCGIYSLRMSTARFPDNNEVPRAFGNEGIPCVNSPMAKSLEDLRYFIKSVFSMKPWEYDYSVTRLPWREDATLPGKPTIGVLRHNGLQDLTPACERALNITVDALKAKGYQVVDFTLPRPGYEYHRLSMDIHESGGYHSLSDPLLKGENNDAYVGEIYRYSFWPRWLLRTYEWIVRNILRNPVKADCLRGVGPISTLEYFALIRRREELRLEMWNHWKHSGIDFLISPPAASPALKIGSPSTFHTILYCSLWNLLNYPSGIVPVTQVDRNKDALPPNFSTSGMHPYSRLSFLNYDADEMHGLPLAVQVSGLREHDEEVIEAMSLVEEALHAHKVYFKALE